MGRRRRCGQRGARRRGPRAASLRRRVCGLGRRQVGAPDTPRTGGPEGCLDPRGGIGRRRRTRPHPPHIEDRPAGSLVDRARGHRAVGVPHLERSDEDHRRLPRRRCELVAAHARGGDQSARVGAAARRHVSRQPFAAPGHQRRSPTPRPRSSTCGRCRPPQAQAEASRPPELDGPHRRRRSPAHRGGSGLERGRSARSTGPRATCWCWGRRRRTGWRRSSSARARRRSSATRRCRS